MCHAVLRCTALRCAVCGCAVLCKLVAGATRAWHAAAQRAPPPAPTRACPQNKGGEFSAPLTSFDWNELDPRRIGTASIDTTCTVWDVERGLVDTQLIAHDKEVRRRLACLGCCLNRGFNCRLNRCLTRSALFARVLLGGELQVAAHSAISPTHVCSFAWFAPRVACASVHLHFLVLCCPCLMSPALGCPVLQVYDIAWGGVGIFASVSADGSVRVFDLRCAAMGHGWLRCS